MAEICMLDSMLGTFLATGSFTESQYDEPPKLSAASSQPTPGITPWLLDSHNKPTPEL
jgi:hypothetical protein